ncbi:hypothetical protein MKK63_04135 [Methylobacterium sp. J-088]|uniref:hypothetical protein n=1 Tax=Methylobacterium sp. J-088 TaxID=2836664 RepID=UPI001FBBF7B5|nr:hypothetical protein [Methylobacterium sp. J-088]MCJ2061889.1 hypothetical protein [Methylobacterium sp. J-088]
MISDFMNEEQARDYIKSRVGHPMSRSHLRKLRCVGGGPEFEKWGRFVTYPREALDAWIEGRFSGRRRSTSDKGAQKDASFQVEPSDSQAA